MTRTAMLAALILVAASTSAATVEVPVYPVPEDNAFDHYLRATELFPEERLWDAVADQLDGLDPAEAELIVLDAGAVLEEFRLGLDHKCLMPGGGDFSTTFPYLADFRSLVRLLMVESYVRQERGDIDLAFGSCLDALKLGRDVARGGPLIHKLVSIACEATALRRIRAMAPMGGEPEPLVQLIARLAEVEGRETPLSETLAVEWDWTRRSLEDWRVNPEKRAQMGALLGKPTMPPTDALLDDALAQLESYYAQMIAAAKMDYWRWTHDEEPPKGNPVAETIAPAIGRALEREVRHFAELRATLAIAALELHLARNGQYPATLAELSPDPLATLPVDPFSGESFIYRREGDLVYTLYSVGPDMTDDGGLAAGPGDAQGDIVFSAVE